MKKKEFDMIWDKASNIIKAIVYFVSNKGKKELPTIEEFVLSELVTTLTEYLSTEKNYSGYFRRMENGQHMLDNYNWQIKTKQLVENLFLNFKGKFPKSFSMALQKLITLNHYTDHGEKWWDCWLYDFYKGHICNTPFCSTFSPSVKFINNVEANVLPLLSRREIKHIQDIADIMKKYVDEDIKFIKKQYNW